MFKKILTFFIVFTLMFSVISLFDNSSSNNTRPPSSSTQKPTFDDKVLVCLGDSIFSATTYAEPVPVLVERELGFYESVNMGISGSTLAFREGRNPMVDRYVDVPENADVIVVKGGVNDIYASVPLGTIDDTDKSTFYGALNIIAKGLTESHPKAYIVFCTIIPALSYQDESDLNDAGYSIVDMNNAVKEVADKYDIDLCDLYTLCGKYDEANYVSDGDHPADDFYRNVLAQNIADFIEKNYK